MNMMNLATMLFGRSRAEENIVSTDATTRTYIGTATSDSSDGSVYVALSEDVTMPDDYDGEHGVGVEMPTTVGVSEGDDVVVTVFGGGTMKAPVVTGNPGWGDAVQEQAANAETIAEQAEAVANATGQHFWPDEQGVHVTEVTQDEWNDSTSTNYHSGANVLLNALGQLFRDGLNNILAIVSGTDPGVAIYDGEGNTADNIMALFSKALIRIGGRLLGTGTSTASVQFFQSDASQTDVTATHTVGSTTPPTGPDDVYGVNHGVQVTTSTDDSELGEGAEGHAAWAALDLFADVNPDYEAGHAMLKATTGGTPYDSSTDPTLGVLRQVADNGTEASIIYGSAAEIQLNDTARYRTGVVTVERAINVLSSPVTLFTGTYAETHSAAVTLSETAANFSRMLIEWETSDGNQGSTMLSNPNGKRFECVAVNCGANANPITYIKWKVFRVNGTQISNYSTDGTQANMQRGEVGLRNNGSTTTTRNEYIGIIRVLGWR